VDVTGPAFGELVAAVVLAEHGVGPPLQVGQPCVVDVAVQADPAGRGGPARGSGIEGVGDGLGQLVEPGGQVQVGVQPGTTNSDTARPLDTITRITPTMNAY
jgi:hypothetical protein